MILFLLYFLKSIIPFDPIFFSPILFYMHVFIACIALIGLPRLVHLKRTFARFFYMFHLNSIAMRSAGGGSLIVV